MTNNKEEKRKKLKQEILDEKWEKIQRNRGKVLAEYKKDIQEPIEEIKEKTPAHEIYLDKETREERLISNKSVIKEPISITIQEKIKSLQNERKELYFKRAELISNTADLDDEINKVGLYIKDLVRGKEKNERHN